MKMTPKPHQLSRRHQITTLALNFGLFAGLSVLPLQAQDDENIPAGYTEDEWFDPGDWFDGNNIEPARTDWWDNDGWSNTTDYNTSPGHAAYDTNRTTATNIQSGRNQKQNRSDQQARRNQQQNWSDNQAGRNQQQEWSDNQASRNQQQDRSAQQMRLNQQQDWSDRNPQAQRDQDQSTRTVSFSGKVDGFKKVNFKNDEGKLDEQTFARIRLNNDRTQVVSIGSRLNLSDLDLEQGDRISVSGRKTRINNRDVLVASRIEVGDKLFRIRKQNRPEIGQHVSINGTVKESAKTSLSDDSREKNLLIRLELENGTSCVVDLGRDMTLSDLDIEEGSEIRLQGEKVKVDGKSLIIASMISLDGERTRLREQSKANESPRRDREESWQDSDRDTRSNSLEPVSHN